jgi:hypothetical protein
VDRYLRRKLARRKLTDEQIVAETDKSNGVLLASGYIAGGAIAGILVALFSLDFSYLKYLKDVKDKFGDWAAESNPFFAGPNSDWLGAIPFWLLALLLYYVGRELVLKGKKS